MESSAILNVNRKDELYHIYNLKLPTLVNKLIHSILALSNQLLTLEASIEFKGIKQFLG